MSKDVNAALYNAMDEYFEMFGDTFPTMFFQSLSPVELLDLIQECLDKGEKYELNLPEGALS